MNWPPYRDSKADVSSASPSSERRALAHRSDEGLVGYKTFFEYLLSFPVSSPRGTGISITSFIC